MRCLQRAQSLLDYAAFRRLRQLRDRLPLAPLLERQQHFLYKYSLPRYIAMDLDRKARLAILLHHYEFLERRLGSNFFAAVAATITLWSRRIGDDLLSISLSYPRWGHEAELSLNFLQNGVVLQVVGFVIAPGTVVGAPGEASLIFGQVQGVHNAVLMKQATRTLHDTTPAVVLVNAAYGVAAALGVAHAAGVTTEAQVSPESRNVFDYSAFWRALGGVAASGKPLMSLSIPAPEKPIALIAANHRRRTRRKRQFKAEIRETVEHAVRAMFDLESGALPSRGPDIVFAEPELAAEPHRRTIAM